MQNRNELATEVFDYDRKTIRNTVDSLAKILAGTSESLETLENGLSSILVLRNDRPLSSEVSSAPNASSPLNIDLDRILDGLRFLQIRIEYIHQRVDL